MPAILIRTPIPLNSMRGCIVLFGYQSHNPAIWSFGGAMWASWWTLENAPFSAQLPRACAQSSTMHRSGEREAPHGSTVMRLRHVEIPLLRTSANQIAGDYTRGKHRA